MRGKEVNRVMKGPGTRDRGEKSRRKTTTTGKAVDMTRKIRTKSDQRSACDVPLIMVRSQSLFAADRAAVVRVSPESLERSTL